MIFLELSAAWWLLLAVPVVLLHMLRLRRRRVTVSSTLLWARALEELEANAPFRRLRRSALLVLQLLAVVGLAGSLMRPMWPTEALVAGTAVLVIDTSASMGAVEDGGASRLDAAKRRAVEAVASLGSGDRLAVVESGATVVVRSPLTDDRARLRSAVDAIRPTDAPGRLGDAILLARELARAELADEVVVLSDGCDATVFDADADADAAIATRMVRIGETGDNVAITALTARINPADGRRRQLFAAVENFSDSSRALSADLRIEGTVLDVRQVDLGPGERRGLIFDLDVSETGLAEVRLLADVRDALAADDVAYAFLPDERPIHVAAATENAFLLRALAVNPRLLVTAVGPGAPPPPDADLLVAEGQLPTGWAGARAPLLAVNPAVESGLWSVEAPRDAPPISSWNGGHPVNAYLNYAGLRVARFTPIAAEPWLGAVAGAPGAGLVWAGDRDGRRVVVLAFDMLDSDLPLRVEFPILLANAASWLAGSAGLETPRDSAAGRPIEVRAAGDRVVISRPDGGSDPLELNDGAATYHDADRVGMYRVEAGAASEVFGVSLLDARESEVSPRDLALAPAPASRAVPSAAAAEREVWPFVLAPLVLLLLAEWALYHRRVA